MEADLSKVFEAQEAADRASVEVANSAGALLVAERAVRDEEFAQRELLKRRGTFNSPSREELKAAEERVALCRKAAFDAKAKHDFAEKAFRAARERIARETRLAYDPLKFAAARRLVEIAERADAKRAELDAIEREFDAVAGEMQAAIAAGAHQPNGFVGVRFATFGTVETLRQSLRNAFGPAAA